MPDIPNPNVTIPLIIIIICGFIAWVTYGHARRKQEQLLAEREERRNRGRPAEPRPQVYAPGSTQALPAVPPVGVAYGGPAHYDPPPPPLYDAAPPPLYDAPPPPSGVPAYAATNNGAPSYAGGGYQLPPIAYEPPAPMNGYDSSLSDFPSTGSWGPPPMTPPAMPPMANKDISELAPALPVGGDYTPFPREAPPSPGYQPDFPSSDYAPETPSSYLPSPLELEDWNRQYAPAVEEWILNHEQALDAVTVQHIPVDALDRNISARKVELTSHLDYAAYAHPSRQQGAELTEMLRAADGTLDAMRIRDFGGAEQNHARYLSYRDIWLPRVQRALAP